MNAARRAILRFERNLVVQAGAGTGKTYNLVGLYLALLAGLTSREHPLDPGSILAVTFTDKAAAEMRERLRARVARLCDAEDADPDLCFLAQEYTKALPPTSHWEEVKDRLDTAFVGTFHSLCARLLRANALAAGLDPNFTVLMEDQARELFEEAAREVVSSHSTPGGLAWRWLLTRPLRGGGLVEGVLETLGRLYLAMREADLPLEGTLLAGGYQADALEEDFHQGVRALVSGLGALAAQARGVKGAAGPKLTALGAWLDTHGAALGGLEVHSPDVQLLRGWDELLSRLSGDLKDQRDALKDQRDALLSLHATWHVRPLVEELEALLLQVHARYRELKQVAGGLDFTDLLVLARDLLRSDEALRRRLRAEVRVVLVDEFQDTNKVQKDLVYLLSEQVGAQGPSLARQTLFIVGDRKQSIYAFRGADVAVFGQTLDEIAGGTLAAEPAGRPVALVDNFRSVPPLIHFTNELFGQVMVGGEAFEVHFDPELDALQAVRPPSGAGSGAELITLAGEDDSSEEARDRMARAVAARIEEILRTGAPLVHPRGAEAPRPPRAGDIVILLRRFTHLHVFVRELMLRRIPHQVLRGQGYFAAQEVRDLTHALELLIDTSSSRALLGVLRSPLVGLSDTSITWLALQGEQRPGLRWDRVRSAPAGGPLTDAERAGLTAMATWVRELRPRLDRLGCEGTLRALIEATQLDLVLAGTFQGEQKLANLQKLLELARAFDRDGRGGVAGFTRSLLEQLADEPREELAPVAAPEGEVVHLMTIHQSKGLEFPIVILPEIGAQAGRTQTPSVVLEPDVGFGIRLPSAALDVAAGVATGRYEQVTQRARAREVAESLRLFYVACTRAREALILVGEGKRLSWRGLVDLHREVLERDGLLVVRDGRELAERPLPPLTSLQPPPPPSPEQGEQARALVERALPLAPERIRVGRWVVAVTQLDDFQLCPRRYHLWHELSLEEHPDKRGNRRAAPATTDGEERLGPLERGTLAHLLLEKIDLATPEDDLTTAASELLQAQGHEPDEAVMVEIQEDVLALLRSELGRELARARERVRREVPFTLPIQGEGGLTLYLSGKMDLLIEEAPQTLRVVDYKHTRRDGRTAQDYHFQLMAYSLAARRLFGASKVQAEIVFLRDRHHPWREGAAALTPSAEELDHFEHHLLELAGAMVKARLLDDFERAPRPRCDAIECGYVRRCWG